MGKYPMLDGTQMYCDCSFGEEFRLATPNEVPGHLRARVKALELRKSGDESTNWRFSECDYDGEWLCLEGYESWHYFSTRRLSIRGYTYSGSYAVLYGLKSFPRPESVRRPGSTLVEEDVNRWLPWADVDVVAARIAWATSHGTKPIIGGYAVRWPCSTEGQIRQSTTNAYVQANIGAHIFQTIGCMDIGPYTLLELETDVVGRVLALRHILQWGARKVRTVPSFQLFTRLWLSHNWDELLVGCGLTARVTRNIPTNVSAPISKADGSRNPCAFNRFKQW